MKYEYQGSILKRINSPADLKGLSDGELEQLCTEIRSKLIDTVASTGGHLASNLGTVELTVALDITVTDDLRREGVARELINRIQNIRKSSGFEITDKIKITLSKNPQTDDAVNEYKDYICNQVLGTSLTLTDHVEDGTELEFDDFRLYVSVVKE